MFSWFCHRQEYFVKISRAKLRHKRFYVSYTIANSVRKLEASGPYFEISVTLRNKKCPNCPNWTWNHVCALLQSWWTTNISEKYLIKHLKQTIMTKRSGNLVVLFSSNTMHTCLCSETSDFKSIVLASQRQYQSRVLCKLHLVSGFLRAQWSQWYWWVALQRGNGVCFNFQLHDIPVFSNVICFNTQN